MGEKPPILDYPRDQTEQRPAESPALVGLAYPLIGLPIIGSVFLNGDAPATNIYSSCMTAVAFGASLFVVRRRRGSVVGWIGLVLWGLSTLTWIVVPLVDRFLR